MNKHLDRKAGVTGEEIMMLTAWPFSQRGSFIIEWIHIYNYLDLFKAPLMMKNLNKTLIDGWLILFNLELA